MASSAVGCSALPPSTDLSTRISIAASNGRLDLSDCGLVEVPSEVYSLTDLVDLSLAGNRITCISEDLHKLKNLQRLGLAGNALETLPESIGSLTRLQGLWVQGNLLKSLPPQTGELHDLRTLALAGNQLSVLPPSLSNLKRLQILSLAGNSLVELPEGFGSLSCLRILALYGNCLSTLPQSLASLPALEELWLQGNSLESLPSSLEGLISLKQLSVADNKLKHLPDVVGNLQALENLSLYGNNLKILPSTLGHLEKLQSIWLEGNPLDVKALWETAVSDSVKALGISSKLKPDDIPFKFQQRVRLAEIAGTGNESCRGGYFKLQRYNAQKNNDSEDASVVVVAFGSAPAVPNWGGLLNRVSKEMEDNGVVPAFDVLYVVDSWRSWYTQHKVTDESRVLGSYYREEVEAAVKSYKRVILLGDSMGASAALLFSPLATSVMAFCPQVDLQVSSIRPGKGAAWLQEYKSTLIEAVRESCADISVHCGSWSHDCTQASLLPNTKVNTTVHNVNTHRLAKEMDSRASLVPLLRNAIEKEMSRC